MSLGGLWGQGSGLGSSLRLLWAQVGWTGLDVQWGLLASEEPEHGGRHGLHVDLSTREGLMALPASPPPPCLPTANHRLKTTLKPAVCVTTPEGFCAKHKLSKRSQRDPPWS